MIAQKDILDLLLLQQEDEMKDTISLLSLSDEVKMIIRDEKTAMPFHLNLLEAALDGNMKETAHSRFLWQLFREKRILDNFAYRFFNTILSVNSKYLLNIPDKFRIDISLQTETDFYIF